MLAFIYGSEVVVEPRQVAQDESEASEESSDLETSCVGREPGPVEKATGMLLGLLRSASPPRGRRQGQPAPRSLSPAPELARERRSTTPDWVSSLGAVPQPVQSQKDAEIPTMHEELDRPADATATFTPAPAPSPAEPAPALSSDASEGSIFRFRSARAREVEKSLAPTSVGGEEDAEAQAVTEESVAAGMPEDAGQLKDTVLRLLRVITAPITLPMWILFQTGSITLTLVTRLYLTMHAVLFDEDPAKFERILMRNVHFMDGSMRQMNSSLTAAISTVDRQIGDINRLESMWHKEHEAYLTALEEKKLSETEFQATARRFCEELAAAKKAAVSMLHARALQLCVCVVRKILCCYCWFCVVAGVHGARDLLRAGVPQIPRIMRASDPASPVHVVVRRFDLQSFWRRLRQMRRMLGNCAWRAPNCRTGSSVRRTRFIRTLIVCRVRSARVMARWEGSMMSCGRRGMQADML